MIPTAMENSTTQYQGRLTSEVRIQLTDLVRVVALANIGSRPSLKKICGIAIELLDNAQRYCTDGNVRFGWEIHDDNLVITVENLASSIDAQRLMGSVQAVNAMNVKQITEAFRSQLTNGEFGEKGGAGLGMLDIARKAKSPIHADITPQKNENFLCKSSISIKLERL